MSLQLALQNHEVHASAHGAEPLHFDAGDSAALAALNDLLSSDPPRFVHDTLRQQLGELVELRAPDRKLSAAEIAQRVAAHLGERDISTYGTWVLFPWSSRLVRVLPKDEFREVRTARNRYKITASEQARLEKATIGVVGLSVGNMAAVTFALEGVGGTFIIADFDELSLSNLNRLRGGVHDLAVNKTVLAAREMYELDPYLTIQRFPSGVNDGNMDDFLLGHGKLDLLVEECDDLYVKIAIRERCRELRIPVVMDTSDRGLLDVERYDLQPDRPVLHGLVGGTRAEALRGLPTKEKVPIVLNILGGHAMSPRMAASLPEVEQSISTWPQLASGVALGGAITADAARRILLGEYRESGRYYVDVETIVRDGTGMFVEHAPPPPSSSVSELAMQPRAIPPAPPFGNVNAESIRWIVANAILSPSAHNSQPWRFIWRNNDVLDCIHDPAHDLPSLDFEHTATWLTFGCLAETIEHAARAAGLQPAFETFPDSGNPDVVLRIRFAPAAPAVSSLFPFIPQRVTNRRRGERRPLISEHADALNDAAASAGCRLQLLQDAADLDELGYLIGRCDRLSAMNRSIHGDTMPGYRWTSAEVEAHRDGVDIATMELTAAEQAGMKLLSEWTIMETLHRLGGGSALEDLAHKLVAGSSAIGLLTTPGIAREDFFRGGRCVQRVWLTATSCGLSFQPMTGLPYLFARLERGAGAGLDSWQVDELRVLRERYNRRFDVAKGEAELFLFRVSYAQAPSAISLRRPLEAVLSVE